MQELKQATTVTVPIGPFVTSDGTAVTGLTISIADVRMFYNGASAVAKVDSVEPTHNELGFYLCEFNHTDTSALGNDKRGDNRNRGTAGLSRLRGGDGQQLGHEIRGGLLRR